MTKQTMNPLEKLINQNFFDFETFLYLKQMPVKESILNKDRIVRNSEHLMEWLKSGKILDIFKEETVSYVLSTIRSQMRSLSEKELQIIYSKLPQAIILDSILDFVGNQDLSKIDYKYINSLDELTKNDLVKKIVLNSDKYHSFSFTDYSGDWNEITNETPFYFSFISSHIEPSIYKDFLINKDKFDLTLRSNHGCFLTHSFEIMSSAFNLIVRNNTWKKLILLFPNADLLSHITGHTYLQNDKELFKQFWKKNKDIYTELSQINMLRKHFNFNDAKCFFLKEAETICREKELFLLDYIGTSKCTRPNLDFLQKNFNFKLLSRSNMKSCDDYISNRNNGISLSTEFNAVQHLIDIEPENVLYLNINHLTRTKNIVESSPKSVNNTRFLKFYNTVEKVRESLQIKDLNKSQNENLLSITAYIPPSILFKLRNNKKDDWASVLGLNESLIKKTFYTTIVTKTRIKIDTLLWVKAFRECNMNYDRIINFMNKNKAKSIQDKSCVEFINVLKDFYCEEKIFNIIQDSKGEEVEYILDTIYALKKINKNETIKKQLKKKAIDTIKELHDEADKLLEYVNQDNFKLNQTGIEKLEDQKVDKFVVQLPKTSHDLIDIGAKLNICVGNGSYAEDIKDNEIFIVTLNNTKGEVIYCVELSSDSFRIKQAKGQSNVNMGENLKSKLMDLIHDQYEQLND